MTVAGCHVTHGLHFRVVCARSSVSIVHFQHIGNRGNRGNLASKNNNLEGSHEVATSQKVATIMTI